MAQVHTAPGVQEGPRALAVVVGTSLTVAQMARNTSTLTTVSYSQNEPGAPKANRN